MVYDVITYNGEEDLFDLRYNILKDYVDQFIVVEFDKTFSGRNKLFFFPTWKYPKVKFMRMREKDYIKYKDLALSSPNTQYGKGAEHWVTEFCQKESIKDCLNHLKDDDIVFISDCDEIWASVLAPPIPTKLKLQVYTYYLNNLSTEEFWGTLVAQYKDIKNGCLNHLRTNALKTQNLFGWHFTSLKDNLYKKLTDSYTDETYATKAVLDNLEKNITDNKDFLGRDFTFQVDESQWPEYLKENKEKYLHLCK